MLPGGAQGYGPTLCDTLSTFIRDELLGFACRILRTSS